MDKTQKFYKQNAINYFNNTKNIDNSIHYNKFFKYIKSNGSILDLGCGSGRDSYHFKNLGYNVTSYDYTYEFNDLAKDFFNINIINIDMRDLCDIHCFDAIWAFASVLHLNKKELNNVIKKVHIALNDLGIFYVNLKINPLNDKRFFIRLTPKEFSSIIEKNGFKILEIYYTHDSLNRSITWMNFICQKTK